jgi:hypothetical protein
MDLARPDIAQIAAHRLHVQISREFSQCEQVTEFNTTYLGLRKGEFGASSQRLRLWA